MKTKEYLPHLISELFPRVSPAELAELVEDIAKNGLQNPITLFEGKILDGRHRYDACGIAEVAPRFSEYEGTDPLGFVLSGNLRRRHLTDSQRAMVAAKLENMQQGRPEIKPANVHVKRAEAAKTLDVSERSVANAKKILKQSPALSKQVENGKITVHAATEMLAEQKVKSTPKQELDKEGHPIPPKILALWNRAEEEGHTALQLVIKLRSMVKKAEESKDILFCELRTQENTALLTNLFGNIKLIVPHGVCTVCNGMVPEKCTLCHGRGFLSAYAYKMFGSDEVKAIRQKGKAA